MVPKLSELILKLARMWQVVTCLCAALTLTGCAPKIYPPGRAIDRPRLSNNVFITEDGAVLPVRSWQPQSESVKGVIIAVHGFNDYSNFFEEPGRFFADAGIVGYAYDQRGFGSGPNRGFWAGLETYSRDLRAFAYLVKNAHPDVPLFVLGESMGGAVAIVTMTERAVPPVDGIILSSPAVWGRETMPWYQRVLLWATSHTVPWLQVTGKGLGITPSDNIEMLRGLGRDPLVIKKTRVDALYGLTNLMDDALARSPEINVTTLMLYGAKDEVIPKQPVRKMLSRLRENGDQHWRVAVYRNGYHMLLRDLQASVPLRDIVSWIEFRSRPLPSGSDESATDAFLFVGGRDSVASRLRSP
ncbi:MAG: lysophospholipase [Pseudomonadota bacterium]